MLNLKDYSLVLSKNHKIIFSSKKSGLKPLVECVKEYKGKYNNCILHDKVIGLAAARLIVYSAMIKAANTPLCSKAAKEFLLKNKIKINAEKIVENILRKDKKGVCPMEMKAMRIEDNREFFEEMERCFSEE